MKLNSLFAWKVLVFKVKANVMEMHVGYLFQIALESHLLLQKWVVADVFEHGAHALD
jgi:hypothetical protein